MNTNLNYEKICTELLEFVRSQIVAEGIEVDQLTVLNSIGIDSFSLIEIVLFIERQYGIVLADESLVPENLKSIDTIALTIVQQLKA
jgi:acyl carrier protein